MPYTTPAVDATMRGPRRSCHRPPMIVPTPRNAMASVKVSETDLSAQCSDAISGFTKTLQPYTAPRQICMTTAATAISQRLASWSGIDAPGDSIPGGRRFVLQIGYSAKLFTGSEAKRQQFRESGAQDLLLCCGHIVGDAAKRDQPLFRIPECIRGPGVVVARLTHRAGIDQIDGIGFEVHD